MYYWDPYFPVFVTYRYPSPLFYATYRINATGKWNVPGLGVIDLQQTGNQVSGSLSGGIYSGWVSGILSDSTFSGNWSSSSIPGLGGTIIVTFSADGNSFSGTATYGNQSFQITGTRVYIA